MNEISSEYFAVVDVETNWYNQVMSIGIVIADGSNFNAVEKKYYVIYPECQSGGYYSDALRDVNKQLITDCSRKEAIDGITRMMSRYNASDILAYNAPFDYKCLNELHNYTWRDILPIAANRSFNSKLPDNCEYYSTGLLKRGRGLQNILRLIYWQGYTERHNALQDALDELQLMQLIDQPLSVYREYKPKQSLTAVSSANIRREESMIKSFKYVIDELCGGSIRLVDCSSARKTAKTDEGMQTVITYYFDLQCSRCGRIWTQEMDAFFRNHKCPDCK